MKLMASSRLVDALSWVIMLSEFRGEKEVSEKP